ncbi:MAG: hypothetical protein DMG69_14835 [Acidobacteria bacterium]|nr:MAG: hypothetical protein DMG69_14835 [Acidobacteriota bacterium]
MVGGRRHAVTRPWGEEIGTDGYAKDAISAVDLARNLMAEDATHIRRRFAVRPKLELLGGASFDSTCSASADKCRSG